MDRLIETWVSNKYEIPYNCTVKTAFISGATGEYDILGLKSGVKARVDDILHLIFKERGSNVTLLLIANSLIEYLPEVSYVEVTMNGEDGVTVYTDTVT